MKRAALDALLVLVLLMLAVAWWKLIAPSMFAPG